MEIVMILKTVALVFSIAALCLSCYNLGYSEGEYDERERTWARNELIMNSIGNTTKKIAELLRKLAELELDKIMQETDLKNNERQ